MTKKTEVRAQIRLPGSPFWNVFRRFGRDEMVALAISVTATVALGFFTESTTLLALAGPVIEKIGFFPAHIYESAVAYYCELPDKRASRWTYLRRAMKHGSVSLIEDILVHDPVYVVLFIALSKCAGIPGWINASFSFLVAVVIVATLEVSYVEIRYALFKRRLRAIDFNVDEYREARFYVRSGGLAEEIEQKLSAGFGFKMVEKLQYSDIYFANDLPRFSGREPVVRLRKRTLGRSARRWQHVARMVGTGYMQTLQVVYMRPQEELPSGADQFRYFSVKKAKFYLPINDAQMPQTINDLSDDRVRALVRTRGEWKRVVFERLLLLDPTETILVAIDTKPDKHGGCVVEIKARTNWALYLEVMRCLMLQFPVEHTTLPKTELGMF